MKVLVDREKLAEGELSMNRLTAAQELMELLSPGAKWHRQDEECKQRHLEAVDRLWARKNEELVELLRDIQQCSLLCDSPYLWGKVDRIVNPGDYKDEDGE